jgi:hypothetical protein
VSRRRSRSATSTPRAERSPGIDHGRVTLARIVRLPRVRDSRKRPASPVSGWIPMRNSSRVRWSKVMTAQARIAVGYYERHDVKELVLDAVLKELTRH